jgi:hypothetical protein
VWEIVPHTAKLKERRTAMKRCVLLVFAACTPVLAGLADDGFLTTGEYVGSVTWRSSDPPLIVDGGGAYEISVRDYGRLIVQSTSTPLQRYVSGVYDILLFNNSQLLYLDGVTEFIRLTQNNTAVLMGGSINYIKTMRYAVPDNENVIIHARDGWSWMDNDPLKGIQGNWFDSGLPFSIKFINDFDYGPVWQNVKVIPEPAALFLFGLGTLLMRRNMW